MSKSSIYRSTRLRFGIKAPVAVVRVRFQEHLWQLRGCSSRKLILKWKLWRSKLTHSESPSRLITFWNLAGFSRVIPLTQHPYLSSIPEVKNESSYPADPAL